MRHRLLIVVVVLATAKSALSAEILFPFSDPRPTSLVAQPPLKTNSLLSRRKQPQAPLPSPLFSLRTTLDSSRQLVRLIDDDEEPGIAYVDLGTHLEPEVAPEDLLNPLPPLAETTDPIDPIIGQPILLDGAAKEAESRSDKKSKKSADTRGSFAWIAGTGNQLGILEWVDRDLAVYDYSVSDRAQLHVAGAYAMRWLTGPTTTDLPPYLFSIFIDVGLGFHLSDDWYVDVVISPSWNTDFANKDYQLFRLPWQAFNTFKLNEEWKVVLGVTDLAREDIQYLPVAGILFKPSDGSAEYDLVFPRPKAAWCLRPGDKSGWLYVAGELGGGSFSIARSNATHDIVTLRDYRLLIGWESRGEKQHASRIEAGWVFGRAVEYVSGVGNYDPAQTAIIRWSTDY